MKALNEHETETCRLSDQAEKQTLIIKQLSQRQLLQQEFSVLKQERLAQMLPLKQDIANYKEMGTVSQRKIRDRLPSVKTGKTPTMDLKCR